MKVGSKTCFSISLFTTFFLLKVGSKNHKGSKNQRRKICALKQVMVKLILTIAKKKLFSKILIILGHEKKNVLVLGPNWIQNHQATRLFILFFILSLESENACKKIRKY